MSRFALACFCALAFGLATAGAQTTPSPSDKPPLKPEELDALA